MLVENREHLYLIQLGNLLENTEDGICVMDANTLLFEYANKNAQTYLGYSIAELRSLTPRDLQPTENVVIFDEIIIPLYNHQKTYVDFETVVMRPDSSTFSTEVRLYFWSEGARVKLVGIFKDISQRKQMEKVLRIAAAAFEALEGIVVTDANKTILRVNKTFSQITGYSTEEAVSKMASFLRSKRYDVDFYHSIWAIVDRDGHWQGEVWGRHKNGSEIPFKLSITAVASPEGHITNYVNSFTDITLQKQVEQSLLDARLRLESQVAKVEDELSKTKEASAEVNTALNVLLKYRETDKTEAQSALSNEVEATILPVLKNLKTLSSGRFQSIRMVNILEKSIHQIMKNYGRAAHLDAAYHKLSPIEIQVAAMVRQGLRTKVIAANLNISTGTVDIHRKHIRKKLGLESKSSNLYSYLQSLAE